MVPTLSQIEAYSTDHLVDAADHWDRLADRWEDAHWQVRNQGLARCSRRCASSTDDIGLHRCQRSGRSASQHVTHRPSAGRRTRPPP
jgi:hypothetical protein